MTYPLEGVKILDFSVAMAAPLGTAMLSDMGAEVIKVERIEGEAMRQGRPLGMDGVASPAAKEGADAGIWCTFNRGKKGLAIDISRDRGREIVLKLAKGTDVVAHCFRPGVMERLGLGYEAMSKVNPKVVYCSLSGYGETGPISHRIGGDIWAQAISGMVSLQGSPGGPPRMAGFYPVDHAAAIMTAYAIMLALFTRERTGTGQEVKLNLMDVAMCLQTAQLSSHLIDGKKLYKEGQGPAGESPPAGAYRARDGDVVTMFGTDPQWPDFCKVLGLEHLATDPRFENDEERHEHREELYPLLDEAFSQKTRAEWQQLFRQARMRCDPCLTYDELCAQPQVDSNGMIITQNHPVRGEIKILGVPVKLSRTPGVTQHPAPLLGQHTEEILLRLGYTAEDISGLEADGIINRLH